METKTLTYEEQKEFELAKINALNVKFRAVMGELGYPLVTWDSEERWNASVEGRDAEAGEGVWLRASLYEKWRVKASGVYPREKGGYVDVYDPVTNKRVSAPSITVSGEKSATQIARDVERRLLPDYRKRLALVRARVQAGNDWQAETERTLESVKGEPLDEEEKRARVQAGNDWQAETERTLESVKGEPLDEEEKRDREVNFYRETGKLGGIKASGKGVSLEVSDVTPDQARRILGIIREKGTE